MNACSVCNFKSDGRTALHFAAVFGQEKGAYELIENGADIAIRDDDGHTPAELASLCGHDMLSAALGPDLAVEVSIS